MQYPSAYYLLLIYLTVVCKPIIPLLQDAWAHTFYEVEHMATVHQHNGSQHAHFEMGKMAADDGPANTSTGKPKPFQDITVHVPAANNLAFNNGFFTIANNYLHRSATLPIVFSAIISPPPKTMGRFLF